MLFVRLQLCISVTSSLTLFLFPQSGMHGAERCARAFFRAAEKAWAVTNLYILGKSEGVHIHFAWKASRSEALSCLTMGFSSDLGAM